MKKFAKIFAMIAVCFVCVLGFTACGKPKDNPIVSAVVKSGLETTVEKDTQLETSNVVVTVTYKDKTTKDVSATDLEFSSVDTTTVGEKTMTITFKDYSFDVTITVIDSTIVSAVVKSGLITSVVKNRQLETSNVVVTVTFADGRSADVQATDLTFSAVDTSSVGEKTLTITCGDFSFPVTITVVEDEEELKRTIVSAVVKSGLETTIEKDTQLNTSNVVVTVTYGDGRSVDVQATDLTFSSIDTTSAGNKTLTITYNTYSFNETILVIDNTVASAVVKSGLETVVKQNEQLDTSNVVVTVTYADGRTADIQATDLTFSSVDTTSVGDKTLTITYNTYSFPVTITVKGPTYSILKLSSDLVKYYNENKKSDNEELIRFEDGSQDLLAGQQNTFHFRLNAAGIKDGDEDDDEVTGDELPEFETVIKVEILRDSAWVELSEAQLEQYVSVNTIGAKFNFEEKAIGEKFRITVRPLNAVEGVPESQISFTQEIKVVDAFNVYTAKDLCVFDNAREMNFDPDDCYDWSSFKQANGYAGISANGIVLQADVYVTADDVPSEIFFSGNEARFNTIVGLNLPGVTEKTLKGTPIDEDGIGIYSRIVSDGEEFNFYGNYFTVNFSQFPKMIVDQSVDGKSGSKNHYVYQTEDNKNGSMMTAHLTAFYTRKMNEATQITKQTSVNWLNVAFFGNGGYENDKVYENSGGLLLMKNEEIDLNVTNTVINNFYICFLLQSGNAENQYLGNYTINKSRGFNSYQCLLYLYGAKNVKVIDSTFKNAGGPAIIADHVDPDEDQSYPTGLDIINSTIESKVTGVEPWFATYGATEQISQIIAMNAAFAGESKGLISKEDNKSYLNLVLIYKSSSAEAMTAERVSGHARIFETQADYDAFYDKNNPTSNIFGLELDKDVKNWNNYANFIDVGMGSTGLETSMPTISALKGNVYFQDSKTGKYTDAGTIQHGQGNGDPYCATVGNRISAETKYVNVYLATGMAAILGTFAQSN